MQPGLFARAFSTAAFSFSSLRPRKTTFAPCPAKYCASEPASAPVEPLTTIIFPVMSNGLVIKISSYLLLRQRLPLGLGEEGQRDNAEQQYHAHAHAAEPEGLDFVHAGVGGVAQVTGEGANREGGGGGGEAPEVVTEAGAGAAEARGEYFREVDGVDGKDGILAKAHDGEHPIHVGEGAEVIEGEVRGEERAEEREGKGELAALGLRDFHEGYHAEEAAGILEEEAEAAPEGLLGGKVGGGEAVGGVVRADDVADDGGVEIADAPEADDAGAAEEEAEPGVLAPAGVREEAGVGAEFDAAFFAVGFRGEPFFGFLGAGEEDDADERGDGADEEHGLPFAQAEGDERAHGEEADGDADGAGGDVAPRGDGLEDAGRGGAGGFGDGVGHERDGEAEDAADAEAGEGDGDAENEVCPREGAEGGEEGVESRRKST